MNALANLKLVAAKRSTTQTPAHQRRAKLCNFCLDKIVEVPYKDADMLRRYLTDRARVA